MKHVLIILLGGTLLLGGWGSCPQAESGPPLAVDENELEAVLETDAGKILIRFFPADAPRHVVHFIEQCNKGAFEGTTFFRVIRYGIIQGGDPLTRDPAARDLYGTGGLHKLQAEFNERPCRRGAVAAVLVPGNPDSAGDQFFICVTDQLQLTGQYTVFGEVVAGMKTVEQISLTPADERSIATERVAIRRTTVRPVPLPPFRAASPAELGRYRAVINTDLWEITLRFYPEKAPEHVRQFLNFARSGFYDGTNFHRIVPGFVVQGGAIQYRVPPLDEEYGAWLQPLKAEFNDTPLARGSVAMARADDPDSGLDSFFICLGRQPHLDGKYTVFGEVMAGMDVVTAMAGRDLQDEAPVERIAIRSIRLEEVDP